VCFRSLNNPHKGKKTGQREGEGTLVIALKGPRVWGGKKTPNREDPNANGGLKVKDRLDIVQENTFTQKKHLRKNWFASEEGPLPLSPGKG